MQELGQEKNKWPFDILLNKVNNKLSLLVLLGYINYIHAEWCSEIQY